MRLSRNGGAIDSAVKFKILRNALNFAQRVNFGGALILHSMPRAGATHRKLNFKIQPLRSAGYIKLMRRAVFVSLALYLQTFGTQY